ncbi:sulfite exporter TauE/SafE family protein [Ramlibacter sp. USB13]|uniref:Probable membrane transporter protein n=1 Tax=Ramlibacter cellulosilyticus TaxID=2764187 RepID=A0A923MW74_9BURK|nr:sulfite exporter TauE/SafE family protein [Ramlibacter cellulosilyticus]MBC5785269.1 sulfite exporter TauE/SafE family protein [Ramlibacter cellulosilyticus]
MSLPLITDWHFYAAAIPAVLLLGISKSGFGAGFGSLAVPLMALAVTVPQAAAILMPILFVMDVMGLAAYRGKWDAKLLRFLVPAGLVGTVIGTVSFRLLDATLVAGIVGVFTLLFLAQRLAFPPRADSKPPPRWLGAVLTATSGFTSFVAHAGGPPVNAYVLPLRLAPVTFAATMSVFFFVINLSKWIPYGWLGLLDLRNMSTSLALMPFAPVGVLVGVRLAHRIQPKRFYQLIYLGMLLTGLKLVWDAFGPA